MKPSEDAIGQALLDFFHRGRGFEIVERDDGDFHLGAGPHLYFSEFDKWRQVERDAMGYVKGRVLEIGCGAGRFLLWLRDHGHDVVGIDNSPGAIEVCRLRGLDDVHVMSIGKLPAGLGLFDTTLLLGGNLGLLGTTERGKRLLKKLYQMTTPGGRLLGASRDRTNVEDLSTREYVARNLQGGRLSGQQRIRIRYRKFATPFYDYCRITKAELEELIRDTGWVFGDVLDTGDGIYVASLEHP